MMKKEIVGSITVASAAIAGALLGGCFLGFHTVTKKRRLGIENVLKTLKGATVRREDETIRESAASTAPTIRAMRRCMHIMEPHGEIQSIPYFSVSRCNGFEGSLLASNNSPACIGRRRGRDTSTIGAD